MRPANTNFALATVASLLALSSACVTQGTYDALQRERDTSVSERDQAIAKLDGRVKSLAAQLAAEEDKVKDLLTRIDRLTAEMAAATKDKSQLQASVEDMAKALAELEKRRAEAEARVAEFKSLLARFRKLIDAGKLKVKIVDGRMVVVLATDILFASGSAHLSKDGKSAVAEVAGVLATIPERAFQVEGHTDTVPIATAQYPSNWELAAARAITVLKALVDGGLDSSRVSAASFAETRPVAPNDTHEGKALNRRIEIIIVPDLSTLPGFEELKRLGAGS